MLKKYLFLISLFFFTPSYPIVQTLKNIIIHLIIEEKMYSQEEMKNYLNDDLYDLYTKIVTKLTEKKTIRAKTYVSPHHCMGNDWRDHFSSFSMRKNRSYGGCCAWEEKYSMMFP